MISIVKATSLTADSSVFLASFIGTLVLFILLAPLLLESRSQSARLRQAMIYRHRANLRAKSLRRIRASHFFGVHSLPMRLANSFALLPNSVKADSQKLLRAAGYCGAHATMAFWAAKAGFLILAALGLIVDFLFHSTQGQPLSNQYLWYTLLGFGFFLPDLIVKRQKKLRQRRLNRSLPDGLDLLVICAEAGLSLDASLRRVADEFVSVVPELSEELLLTSVELNFLPDRRQALSNLGNRVELPAFRGVVATLIQTEKYGTPLAQALRALASEFREHRLLAAEEKASRLPAILTVPMIIFILPALFIILAAPAFIQVSEKFSGG